MQAKHTLVVGPSGGGKTTLLREGHAGANCPSIFLTTKDTETKAKHNPPSHILKASANYPEDIQVARNWAHKKQATQIIVDECQNAPTFTDGANGPLKNMLHEDRDRGVKAIISTQNPQHLHTRQWNYGPVEQCEYWVFCGKVKDFHVGFLRDKGLTDVIQHLPKNNWEYVTIDPTAALAPEDKIVYRGTTNKKFA